MIEINVIAYNQGYLEYIDRWEKIRSFINNDIKKEEVWSRYLPLPFDGIKDLTPSQKARRQNFVKNARLMNVAQRTLATMSGMVNSKANEEQLELSSGLEYLEEDATGNDVGLLELIYDLVEEVSGFGRAGLFVDASNDNTNVDVELGARILPYKAEQIIDWSEIMIGTKKVLSMVSLLEVEQNTAIGLVYQIRTLYLDGDGLYAVDVEKFLTQNTKTESMSTATYQPTAQGQRLDFIPFVFVGSRTNNATIDTPPIESLVDINIGHLLNSAETEESSFYLAPTGFVNIGNFSIEQFREANPEGIELGTNSIGILGEGGSFQYIQPQPSMLSKELMADKQQQMTAIGGQLINAFTPETAEAARIQKASDSASLVKIVNNIENAMLRAINYVAYFNGITTYEVKLDLDRSFAKQEIITSQDLQLLITGASVGTVAQETVDKAINSKFNFADQDQTLNAFDD